MKQILSLMIIAIITATLLTAGCVESPDSNGVVTPTPEITPVPTEPAPAEDLLVPGPLGTMPPGQDVQATISRDPLRTDIYVTFNGGRGMSAIVRLDATMYASDGRVEEQSMARPRMGESITFTGTRGTDRVKVTVLYNTGEVVVINDGLFEYRSR
ncbi:hypothetical protein J2T58_000641 [Methanocalculus alkaliphilus]|uniref:hypothetical protein n=1 Tax=Methanocalculus alkaliphilus TaxID=768730 RepID=UPI00209E920F|nr:hypothetical protein [Methanocalculus alkaliphilus]MCP1714796.1 hypothetical protein [Methanocalculus alkaliphilus]